MTIMVIDYGRGNLFSLGQALRHLGVDYEISGDPGRIAAAERIIFPGVGAFGDAAAGLVKRGLVEPLQEAARKGTPLLGICVGCQMLMEQGEEFGTNAGLGLIAGSVTRLPDPQPGDETGIRIPNVGWRRLNVRPDTLMLDALGQDDMVYFVHSFAPRPADEGHVLATLAINGEDVPVAVRKDNIAGVQFHPEKSGAAGLRLLHRFASPESVQ